MRLTLSLLLYMVFFTTFSEPSEKFRLERLPDGVILYYPAYTLKVQVCSPRIFHVVCVPDAQIPEGRGSVVTALWDSTGWDFQQKGQTVSLKTSEILAEIDLPTLLCRFKNIRGELLLEEKERAFSPVIREGRSGWNSFETFKLTPDEGIYGLGWYQNGWRNHRGKEVVMVQTLANVVNSFLVSTKGWGILWDNDSKTYFRDNKNGATFWSESGDVIGYYLFFGNTMDEVIAGYRWATGEAPLLSKWAYGYWHGKDGYESAKEVTDMVAEYRMRRLPIDFVSISPGYLPAHVDSLRRQVSAGLHLSASGIHYWTSDIGGSFTEGKDQGAGPGLFPAGCRNPAYKERYVRWFQRGAFSPVFRSGGAQSPCEIWHFGDVGDWAYDAMARYLNLRYRLLPYIYSTAWKVTHDGYTMMRGLPMDFPEDKKVYDLENEYLFGRSFLVCPVIREQYFPLDTVRQKARPLQDPAAVSVYLPKGTDWVDFWTGERLSGGETIARETPIEILPLYIRAGSIIPLGPFLQYAEEKAADPIELRIYPGHDGSFTLYEDDGDTYHYESGAYSTIGFTWNHEKGMLTIGKRKGSFPGMLQNRTFRVVVVTPGSGTGVESTPAPNAVIHYNGDELMINL